MKKFIFLLLFTSLFSMAHASKLSHFLNKMKEQEKVKQEQEKARQAQEWRQDMNFGDFYFRLLNRYINNNGEHCRDYDFRSRSNPYRHGAYTVCDGD